MFFRFFNFVRLVAAILVLVSFWPQEALAQARISLIRDAEIETIIRNYATPLFEAAELDPASIGIHIVANPRLNAFVAAGQNLFLNTGLLIEAADASQVIGVIAHETGHIAGGHLIRGQEALRGASMQTLIAAIVGIGVGIATGSGQATSAILTGGSGIATSNFLQFSRGQEAAADQAGLTFLEKTDQSAAGFLGFLEILEKQDLLSSRRQSPYLRTHPLTRDRVRFVREYVSAHPNDVAPSPEVTKSFGRIQAKLIGFMQPFRRVMRHYPKNDTSLEAKYAHSIAYYRREEIDRALPLIDALIEMEPGNPYFHELRGQMLFENGRLEEALPSYKTAVSLDPASALLRMGLAHVQLEIPDSRENRPAMEHLLYAIEKERDNPQIWQLLAIGYGREKAYGMSALALAEKALRLGDKVTAIQQATRAQKKLPKGSPGWIRAQDIKITTNLHP